MRQILPLDCEAAYWRGFLDPDEAKALFVELQSSYELTDKTCTMGDGTVHEAALGTFLFTDAELTSLEALPEAWGRRAEWPASLATVRDRIETELGMRFQVARCVYYADGSEGMSFHTDLPAYGSTDAIASMSLGAEREFRFRSISDPDDEYGVTLHDGSLLFMGKGCQDRYQHGLPLCDDCRDPRINLTFRKYGWD